MIRQRQASLIIWALRPLRSQKSDWLSRAHGRTKRLHPCFCLNPFGFTDWWVLLHRCVSALVSEHIGEKLWSLVKNGRMYGTPAVFKYVFVFLRVYIWFSRCDCMWLYPRLGLGQPEWGHDWWLVYCSESLLNESKMEFRTNDFIRPAQLNVRLMKCGKLFSFGSDHAIYSTIRSLLDRVSALSCHHCERTDTRWSAVTELIVVPLRKRGHALSPCSALQGHQSGVRAVHTEGVLLFVK